MLQFTTGCSRLPAQGFKALQSNDGNYRRFNIQAISKKVGLSSCLVCLSVHLCVPESIYVCPRMRCWRRRQGSD